MSRQKAFGVFSIVAAMMCTGCGPTGGGGNNDNNGGGGGALTQEQFAERAVAKLSEGACAATWDCANPSVDALLSGAGRTATKEDCVTSNATLLGANLFGEEFAAAAAGRLEFDQDAASTCLSALDARFSGDACSYSLSGSLDSSCERVFVGTVEVDGNCAQSLECKGDAECVKEDGGDRCFGTCQLPEASCGDGVCEDNEYCGFDSNTEQELCLPKLKAGDACDYDSDCTLESPDVECLTDEFGEDGVCTAYFTVGAGGYCDYDDAYCEEGLSCDFETVTCETPGGGGESVTPSAMGESCDLNVQPCEVGLACVDIDIMAGGAGVCGSLKPSGGECSLSFECEVGLVCKGSDFFSSPPSKGVCGAPAAAGEACEADGDCETLECGQAGVCVREEVCEVP